MTEEQIAKTESSPTLSQMIEWYGWCFVQSSITDAHMNGDYYMDKHGEEVRPRRKVNGKWIRPE